jgi:tetratricopeptide (TPR) repeat protein
VAELVLHKVLALDEKSVAAHNDLGLLALARGDTQLAFEQFEKAVEMDPAFSPARLNRASVLLRAGDYAAAQSEYDKVVSSAKGPDALSARVGLGVALRGQGKHAEAEKAYEAVLRDSPNDAAALFNLGVLRAEFLDKRSDARVLFERYLDVAASDDGHREAAERYLEQIPEEAAAPAPAADATAPKPKKAAP